MTHHPLRGVAARAIKEATEACMKAKGLKGPTVNEDSAAPIWKQDSDKTECFLCRQPFNLLTRRKHHCRKCGNVVCDSCSPSRRVLENIHRSNKQRVCNMCDKGGALNDSIDDTTLRQYTGISVEVGKIMFSTQC
jgi:hypothetical protein